MSTATTHARMPLLSEVVVARVGHMPISCTSTGLLSDQMPSLQLLPVFISQLASSLNRWAAA